MKSAIFSLVIGVVAAMATFMAYDIFFNAYNSKWMFSDKPEREEFYVCSRGYSNLGGEYLSKVIGVSSIGNEVKSINLDIAYTGGDLLEAMVFLDEFETNNLVFLNFKQKLKQQANLLDAGTVDVETLQLFTRAIDMYSVTLYRVSVEDADEYIKRCRNIDQNELKNYWN